MRLKLSEELIGQIKTLIMDGLFVEDICDYIGINRDTWYEWLYKGQRIWDEESASSNQALFPAEEADLYVRFYRTVKQTEIELKRELIQELREARSVQNAWQNKAWFIERRWQEQYRLKPPDVVINTGDKILKLNMTHEQIEAALSKAGNILKNIEDIKPRETELIEISDCGGKE